MDGANPSAVVREAAERLAQAVDADELIMILRAYVRRAVGADGIAIVLRDGELCHYVEEDAIAPLWKGKRFPLESCVSGWTMLNGRTAVIPDILKDERVPQAAYRSTFVRSMAMSPMGANAPPGAIGAYWASVYTPSAEEVRALNALAELAGTALLRVGTPEKGDIAPTARRLFSGLRSKVSTDFRERLLALLPSETLPLWKGQLLAAALVGIFGGLRYALSPLLGPTGVFISFIPPILVSALWGGPSSAATAIVLSTLIGSLLSYSLAGAGTGWAIFLPVAAIVGLVASSVRTALDFHKRHTDALEEREKQLSSITRELDHRSKNTLAVVSALTHHVHHSANDTTEMRDRLCAHFDTLGTTQTLLLEVGAKQVPLRELLESALLPFASEGRVTLEVDPELAAPPGCEVMLSLAFSELATNACKYGAFSVPSGQVRVVARRSEADVVLVWSESGGPKIEAPSRASTGSRLISRALNAVKNGKVETSYLPAGAVYRFSWAV